jgi:dihydropteroate synthase
MRPLVVGVLNATPDSFHDGGAHEDLVGHGLRMIEEGADWIDVGGESTRPGAAAVSEPVEIERTVPLIEALAGRCPLSIDTSKPAVARAALRAGAEILNDVTGLRDPEMAELSAGFEATIVMHSRGCSRTMSSLTDYGDLIREILGELMKGAEKAQSKTVWIDPGIGFAKTPAQSLSLLKHCETFVDSGYPVLIGASRKSFIGHCLRHPGTEDRLFGSLAAVAAGYYAGARAFRVHDVQATRDVLELLVAIDNAE